MQYAAHIWWSCTDLNNCLIIWELYTSIKTKLVSELTAESSWFLNAGGGGAAVSSQSEFYSFQEGFFFVCFFLCYLQLFWITWKVSFHTPCFSAFLPHNLAYSCCSRECCFCFLYLQSEFPSSHLQSADGAEVGRVACGCGSSTLNCFQIYRLFDFRL